MSDRRLVSFAGGTIEVIERDPDAARLCDFIFGRFPQTSPVTPCLCLDLASDGTATFAMWRDGSLVYRKTGAANAARLLLAEAVHNFAANGGENILVHAAAVTRDGRGFLMPGQSGAGKSSLSAWLDHHGYACLSDELIGVSKAGILLAFPRPICLEPDAPLVVPDLLDAARQQNRTLESDEAILIAPASPIPASPLHIAAIVFPRYERQTETALQPLSRSAAVLRLMGSVANAKRMPDHGFAEIGRLARRVPAFELRYGAFGSSGDAILRMLEEMPVPCAH